MLLENFRESNYLLLNSNQGNIQPQKENHIKQVDIFSIKSSDNNNQVLYH